MRHRFVFLAAGAAAAAGLMVGCGDDKAPSRQAVFWLGLNPSGGSSCSSNQNYQIPDGARATITSATADGARVKDGRQTLVECDVRPAGGTDFSVSLRFQSDEVANFSADGTLSAEGGTLDVSFNTGVFAVGQDDCVATVETLTPGAIWLRGLRCQDMRDPSSPDIRCDGQGGLIFENCDR